MNRIENMEEIIRIGNNDYKYFPIHNLKLDKKKMYKTLPYSIKILLENLLRNCNNTTITSQDILNLLDYKNHHSKSIEIYPSRVLMQDFTGVPAIVDLATMRDAVVAHGKDPNTINPKVNVDLVIDHSVQVDFFGTKDSFEKNLAKEMERNISRYQFLRWGQKNFDNFRIVPPSTGICHQVNLEYLATVVTLTKDGLLYPDTVIGTDSHTTMVNGISVLGCGVGGIEAESVILGQSMSSLIPEVIGVKIIGKLNRGITATDLVLHITNMLRQENVVNKFVEFFGNGLDNLSIFDRATIANMSPECGSTCNFFPIDDQVLKYLRFTGRDEKDIQIIKEYSKKQELWRNDDITCNYTKILELDLSNIELNLAGPKMPQDKVNISDVPKSFFDSIGSNAKLERNNNNDKLRDGSIVIAAITSCTNTSNPFVMLGAGLVAKKAVALGLKVKPWVKTSLAPGSKVVTDYLDKSGLSEYLNKLGFYNVGYGCTTCIGNSGDLIDFVKKDVIENNLYVASILSGNRNFEGRIHQNVKANYLASPPMVVIYAICGYIDINLLEEHIAIDKDGNKVFFKDLWYSDNELNSLVEKTIQKEMFINRYSNVFEGDEFWQNISIPSGNNYTWESDNLYIKKPPFFEDNNSKISHINNAAILAIFGDNITTDHISPAGAIAIKTSAAKYLLENGVKEIDFNSYGARRGNHEVMIRGTFANIRIKNEMLDNVEGGYTRLYGKGETISIFDAYKQYKHDKVDLVVFAGKEYGTGSSRDWAAKGTNLLKVKAIIAENFERIHRSNLVRMGVMPFIFTNQDNRKTLNLIGTERIDIIFDSDNITPQLNVKCVIHYSNIQGEEEDSTRKENTIDLILDIRTHQEVAYLKSGGILQYVLNNNF